MTSKLPPPTAMRSTQREGRNASGRRHLRPIYLASPSRARSPATCRKRSTVDSRWAARIDTIAFLRLLVLGPGSPIAPHLTAPIPWVVAPGVTAPWISPIDPPRSIQMDAASRPVVVIDNGSGYWWRHSFDSAFCFLQVWLHLYASCYVGLILDCVRNRKLEVKVGRWTVVGDFEFRSWSEFGVG